MYAQYFMFINLVSLEVILILRQRLYTQSLTHSPLRHSVTNAGSKDELH